MDKRIGIGAAVGAATAALIIGVVIGSQTILDGSPRQPLGACVRKHWSTGV